MINSLFLKNLMKFGSLNLTFLPNEELDEVLEGKNSLLIVGAALDNEKDELVCCRADGVFATLPRVHCENPHSPTKPDWSNVRPIDYGFAVAVGEFEIAHDYILYHSQVKLFE